MSEDQAQTYTSPVFIALFSVNSQEPGSFNSDSLFSLGPLSHLAISFFLTLQLPDLFWGRMNTLSLHDALPIWFDFKVCDKDSCLYLTSVGRFLHLFLSDAGGSFLDGDRIRHWS